MPDDLTTEELETDGGARPVAVGVPPKPRPRDIPTEGLILVEPFATWVAQGIKPVVIKSRPFKISGRPMLLVTKDRALGVLTLSRPREIGVAEFKRTVDLHRLDEKTRKKFWPGKKKFWAYKVLKLQVFAAPLLIRRPPGAQVTIRDIEFKSEVAELYEVTKADAVEAFRAAVKSLARAAPDWAKSVLPFLQGPPEAVRLVKETPAAVQEVAKLVRARPGEALDLPFPKALRGVLRAGPGALKVLRRPGAEPSGVADQVEKLLGRLAEVEMILPALARVEDEPVIRRADYGGRNAGAHSHRLNVGAGITEFDGAHAHAFAVPDGTVLTSEFDGAHVHSMAGPEGTELSTPQAGEHSHTVRLLDGGEVAAARREGPEHGHALLFATTGYDGPHTHALELPDGAVLTSMIPADFRRVEKGEASE